MPDRYFLTSPRLGFRELSLDDLSLARALWGNAAVTKFIGGPFSEQQIEARLNRELETQKNHGIQYWPIFLLEGGSHVGCAGVRPYAASPAVLEKVLEEALETVLELGVHIRPEFWRRGFAEEASRAVIAFAFSTLNASALFAGHHPENESSRRLLAKLGFQFTHEELYAPTARLHVSYLLRRA